MTFDLFRSRPIDPAALLSEEADSRLVRASRQALAQKSTNPDRIGCPGRDFLLKLARRSLSLEELKPWSSHLSSCGECYREYEALKRKSSPSFSGIKKALRNLLLFVFGQRK